MLKVRATPRRIALVATFLLTVAVVGCDDYKFGEMAESFVANEAYGYSLRLVTADLQARWPNILQVEIAQISLELDGVSRTQPDIDGVLAALQQHPPEQAAVLSLIFVDRVSEAVRRNHATLEALDARLARFSTAAGVCADRMFFDGLKLGALGRISPLGSIVPPGYNTFIFVGVGASTDSDFGNAEAHGDAESGMKMFDSLRSLVGLSEWKRQMRKLDGAIRDYPSHVPGPDKVFELSREICAEAYAARAPELAAAADAVLAYHGATDAEERAMFTTVEAAEARLSDGRLQAAAAGSGVLANLERWRTQDYDGRIVTDLGVVMADVEERRTAAAAGSCFQRLEKIEDADDAAAEAAAEIDAVMPGVGDPGVRERLQDRRGRLADTRAQLAGTAATAKCGPS